MFLPGESAQCAVLGRIRRRDHSRKMRCRRWLVGLPKKLLLAATLIIAALTVHFLCCDWRLPKREYLGSGQYENVFFGNQLFGYVHAGAPFRTLVREGSRYNLSSAFWLGVQLPVLMTFVGMMALLSELAPGERSVFMKRCRARPLGNYGGDIWNITLSVVMVMVMGVLHFSFAHESGGVVIVKSSEDSLDYSNVVLSDTGSSRNLWSLPSVSPDESWSDESSDDSTVIVPEPSTFILLTMGVVGLLAYGWRRRRAGSR